MIISDRSLFNAVCKGGDSFTAELLVLQVINKILILTCNNVIFGIYFVLRAEILSLCYFKVVYNRFHRLVTPHSLFHPLLLSELNFVVLFCFQTSCQRQGRFICACHVLPKPFQVTVS